jgi:hypothetical protein
MIDSAISDKELRSECTIHAAMFYFFSHTQISYIKVHVFSKIYYETSLQDRRLTNPVLLVCEQTIPTERPPLVGEVSANICG